MKRRDLLKGAGAVMLGAPALHASAFLTPNPTPGQTQKDLVVTFNGPFVFWQHPQEMPDHIKVMAPPVGPGTKAAHQPWFGTTSNQKALHRGNFGKSFVLALDYTPSDPVYSGTPAFPYEQGTGTGTAPLFNLYVPIPNIIIGVRPTVAKMKCKDGVPDDYCKVYKNYASGRTFVYQNANLDSALIKFFFEKQPLEEKFFTPCFTNDDKLLQASLGVNLTALDRSDPGHQHAVDTWEAMLSMFPWMQQEITSIIFCKQFDPAECPFDPSKCKDPSKHNPIMVGPGSDCEAPLCDMGGPGAKAKYKKP